MPDQQTPPKAKFVRVQKCECGCGQIYLVLHGADDEPFALAPFDESTALVVASEIASCVEAAGHA